MNLFTYSTTLHEAAGNSSRFPTTLRQKIFQSVEQITTDDMNELLSKHESDPGNFDGRIEANLKKILPKASIKANQRVSNKTRFNSDIVIHIGDASVCLEIEKGYMSRFEFDILKMQTFASTLHQKYPNRRMFGAFIVPADNVVASHISGNSNESSYKYLTRLSRLVAQITPPLIVDILIVGYSTSDLKASVAPTEKRKSASAKRTVHRDITTINRYLVNSDEGAKGLTDIKQKLIIYPLEFVLALRSRLASEFPSLYEKVNYRSPYLGYSNGNQSDALYVYLQKKKMVIDMRVSKEEAENLREKGVAVNPRNNFQGRAGWLTGVSVPYDSDKLDVIVKLAKLALKA
jgi:hypothetical protein